ncbi:MAG: chloride channel protein [Oscillospiraceae bacterium]|nr:chloride channel protein [Oscillospiraceae bacterium]
MRQRIFKILKAALSGAAAGVLTAVLVCLYKFFAHHIIYASEKGYSLIRENLWLVLPAVVLLFAVALLLSKIYSRYKNLIGGGIPNAVAAARGQLSLYCIRDSLGIFMLSLLSFLLGVPLGNEGPSVQMGAASADGVARIFSRDKGFREQTVAAGACAGFAAATGAPLSGVAFCFDEIERKPRPALLFSCVWAVAACYITSRLICPVFKVELSLFARPSLPAFSLKGLLVSAIVGVIFSVFSVVFLKLYKFLSFLYNKALGRLPLQLKIFIVLAIVFAFGLYSFSFISSGHELSVSLFSKSAPVFALALLLAARSCLSLSANINGISGGTFIPIIAVGAALAAILGRAASGVLGSQFYPLVLALGIVCCIAGMMKMPLVSVLFGFEVLFSAEQILYVVIAAAAAYALPALLKVNSINEEVLEKKLAKGSK